MVIGKNKDNQIKCYTINGAKIKIDNLRKQKRYCKNKKIARVALLSIPA